MVPTQQQQLAAMLQAPPRERSYILAQVLQQLQQQPPPMQSYGELAARLGAQGIRQNTANKLADQQAQQQAAQAKQLAQALQQAQGGAQNIPLGLVDGGVDMMGQYRKPDPQGALQSLTAQGHPMAQQLAAQMMGQMFQEPKYGYENAGDKLLETRNGRITGNAVPLGISPNTMFSEGREDARTGARLGLDESQFVRSQEGLDRRFNIGEANESSRADKAEASRSQKATGSLRKEYESLDSVKRYQTVLPIVSGIANAPDTPAGDLAVVYGAAKVLDPDSAVKEGEFDTVLKSKSPMQTVLGGVRFATTGRGRLTPESREEVKAMLMNQANQYRAAYNRDYERYSGYAIDQGVDSEKVVGTRIDSAFTDRRIQRIENEQEYNALPSGATYIGPDGKKRVKR